MPSCCRSVTLLLALCCLTSCGEGPSSLAPDAGPLEPGIEIAASSEDGAILGELLLLLPDGLARTAVDPMRLQAFDRSERQIPIAVVRDLSCLECFQLEDRGRGVVVHGGGVLGIQYGLAAALEDLGIRFFHPERSRVPDLLRWSGRTARDQVQEPEMSVRGLHIHVVHPIEAYFALWEPGPDNVERARRIFAWLIANRGNYAHWPGLNDIERPDLAEAWRAHTRTLLDIAHRQGLRIGFGVQLFGGANLQLAFDLIDRSGDARALIDARLAVLGDLPFDEITVTFGEFGATDAARMITSLETAYDAIQAGRPGAEVAAHIHVGADLRASWMGEDLPFYFLATRTSRPITPWVHTVMYYTLFEDAGGAYDHEDFFEQRDLLLGELASGREVAYFPETAYWVAFDNSVPTYLPLYVRSRFHDLDRVRAHVAANGGSSLDRHVLFTSGWEWGYWQNDVASLRMSWELPDRYGALLEDMFIVYGAPGAEVAAALEELADAQHLALIEQRLASWYAGWDVILENGDALGVRSQPQRIRYASIAALPPAERDGLRTAVMHLRTLAESSEMALERVRQSGAPSEDPFIAEVIDGIEIDAERAHFAAAALEAVLEHAEGADTTPALAEIQARLAGAEEIVARRYAGMHDRDPALLVSRRRPTAGLYDYGYLREAHELCYWDRERAQVRNLVLGKSNPVPGCVL